MFSFKKVIEERGEKKFVMRNIAQQCRTGAYLHGTMAFQIALPD